MPRGPRVVSASGFYHVTMRGNAKSIIFESDDQRLQFLKILEQYRDEFGFRVIAWCLMDNHVHLVLDAYGINLSEAIHHITTTYVMYFNHSEDRVGHVFQSPYRSGPIESNAQLTNTVRYVHLNPVRAGICNVDEYPWSGYREYAQTPKLVDVQPVFGIAGGKEQFLRESLDPTSVVRISTSRANRSDEELVRILKSELGVTDNVLYRLQTSNKEERARLVMLLKTYGASTEQLARLCGMGERSVSRLLAAERKRIDLIHTTNRPLSARRIIVVPYSAEWSKLFDKHKRVLESVLGSTCVCVHHVGSTAVEGLCAKPTVDVLVAVRSLWELDQRRSDLCAVGYNWLDEYGIPGRRYLVMKEGPHEIVHVHAYSCDDRINIDRHLAVRDYLRQNGDAAAEYGLLKMELARTFPYDPEGYWNGKAEYVHHLEALAMREWSKGALNELGEKGLSPNPPKWREGAKPQSAKPQSTSPSDQLGRNECNGDELSRHQCANDYTMDKRGLGVGATHRSQDV